MCHGKQAVVRFTEAGDGAARGWRPPGPPRPLVHAELESWGSKRVLRITRRPPRGALGLQHTGQPQPRQGWRGRGAPSFAPHAPGLSENSRRLGHPCGTARRTAIPSFCSEPCVFPASFPKNVRQLKDEQHAVGKSAAPCRGEGRC